MERLELLKERRSVRAYTERPLEKEIVNKLKAEITMINTHQQGFRFQLILDDPDPMKAMSGNYGAFRNPRNYLAAVVDTATPDVYERAGYFAEQFVIKAVSLGLGTCFVGGTFSRKEVKAQMRAGEKILFIVLVGYPAEKERIGARLMAKLVHIRHKVADSFFEPQTDVSSAKSDFTKLGMGLEGVACAPSSLNRQPVRVYISEENGRREVCAKVEKPSEDNLIDLGIAKFNYNFATETECEWGNGAPLSME